jgi:hypothetical protein
MNPTTTNDDDAPEPKPVCCPEYPFDPEKFLARYRVSAEYGTYNTTASMRGMYSFAQALYGAFDFTDPELMSMTVLKMAKNVDQSASAFGFDAKPSQFSMRRKLDPLEAFMTEMLKPRDYPVAMYQGSGGTMVAPRFADDVEPHMQATKVVLDEAAKNVETQVDAKIAPAVERVARVETQFGTIEGNVSEARELAGKAQVLAAEAARKASMFEETSGEIAARAAETQVQSVRDDVVKVEAMAKMTSQAFARMKDEAAAGGAINFTEVLNSFEFVRNVEIPKAAPPASSSRKKGKKP